MSYEGYTQVLCKKGHYSEEPDDFSGDEWKCHCGEPVAWFNPVDDTNCDSWGLVTLIEEKPRKLKTCPTCNQQEVVEEATFRIPPNGSPFHSPYVILEGKEYHNRFFTSREGIHGDYLILGWADSIKEAQLFLYGKVYPNL
jgi:hypothetical protein